VAIILVKNSEKKLNDAGASRTRTNFNVSQIQKFPQEVKNLEGLSKLGSFTAQLFFITSKSLVKVK